MSKVKVGLMGKEVLLPYSGITAQLGFLKGKVLTVIDASFTDERQVKAVKDLIKNAFDEQTAWIGQLCFPETQMMSRSQVQALVGDPDEIAGQAEELKEGI